MADATERTQHGFTREQIEFLRETLGRPAAQGFDRPTQMWLIGGIVAAGLLVSGALWTEIGSVREELRSELRFEIGSVRSELQKEIRENRAVIAELAKGLARIEAILEERLPRDR
ncbi:MAG: hypothetical protein F4213_19190 [Boseongicola sp. SB0677_bin_26]|nr:hypothetical protein [Boseongicola sp. SB0677_bin_26]